MNWMAKIPNKYGIISIALLVHLKLKYQNKIPVSMYHVTQPKVLHHYYNQKGKHKMIKLYFM